MPSLVRYVQQRSNWILVYLEQNKSDNGRRISRLSRLSVATRSTSMQGRKGEKLIRKEVVSHCLGGGNCCILVRRVTTFVRKLKITILQICYLFDAWPNVEREILRKTNCQLWWRAISPSASWSYGLVRGPSPALITSFVRIRSSLSVHAPLPPDCPSHTSANQPTSLGLRSSWGALWKSTNVGEVNFALDH